MEIVLYITNIEVPYRVKFLNKLAQVTDWTVIYERRRSNNRNEEWSKSIDAQYRKVYLSGIHYKNENTISLSLFKYLNDQYDEIIISCVNSPVQILAMLYMRMKGIRYALSLDGEQFIGNNGFKNRIKKVLIQGADTYLAAGEMSANNLRGLVRDKVVYPYYFSSLEKVDFSQVDIASKNRKRFVLVVGQYFSYKGLDIAVNVAKLDQNIRYIFVGTGKRTDLFCKEQKIGELQNVEVIPFLQKEELNELYKEAALLFLPSRKECWGLVINEAASFGTPIVATEGSGAAIELLSPDYQRYILKANNYEGMLTSIKEIIAADNDSYSKYLREKSQKYSIEKMVQCHVDALGL